MRVTAAQARELGAVPTSKRTAPKRVRVPRVNVAEERFALQLGGRLTRHAVREFRFAPPRFWRFDFAFVEEKLAIEIEGGAFVGGAHTRGAHFRSDIEKYNTATLLGWRLIRAMPEHVATGEALEWTLSALRERGSK